MSEAEDSRVENLRRYIADQEHHWFVLERPAVSMRYLERLRDELAALEAAGAQRSLDSPSWRRGAPPRARLEECAHQPPWGLAPAVHSVADLKSYHARVSAREPDPLYVAAGTLDGAEVILTYERGILTRAVLLGDGVRGIDVTDNVRTVPSVPLCLRPPGTVTESRVTKLTGQALEPSTMTPVPPFPEVFHIKVVFAIRHHDLTALERRRVDAGEPPYASVRGAVLGSLVRLDPRITATRPLSAFAIGCRELPEEVGATWQLLGALKSWGFAILPLTWQCRGFSEVLDFVRELQRAAPSVDYPLAGGLLTLNRGAFGAGEAQNASLPPQTVRLSFPTPGRPARVESVYFAVGRGGTVLPVVLLSPDPESKLPVPDRAPLPADGVKTFLAASSGERLRVRPGTVAPILLREDPTGAPAALERCPACQAPLVTALDEPFLRCSSRACPGRVRARLLHLVGPRGLNLHAVPVGGVDRIANELAVTDGPGLLSLEPERLDKLFPGAGAQLAEAVRSLRALPLWRLVYLLGIPHVGERIARTIAHHIKELDRLVNLRAEEIWRIPDLAPEAAGALASWMEEEAPDVFARLGRLQLEVAGDARVFSAPFYGRRIVVAGTFDMGAVQMCDEIERRGGIIQARVGRTTDLLVVGPDAGQASTQAAAYNVPAIEEPALATVIRETSGRFGASLSLSI